jgi:predicted MFS family arabinose efflux permease
MEHRGRRTVRGTGAGSGRTTDADRSNTVMTTAKTPAGNAGQRAVGAVLFLCLFAGQAGAIALSPVLAEVARDLDVSTVVAGQLRTVAGLVAGVTALALGRLGARVPLRRQLLAGAALLALGSLASAAAPGIGLLAAAQVPVGMGIAILTTAGTLAAAEWVRCEQRTATLSWALIGQPSAWIVGMPLLGVVGELSWRYTWIAFPLVAALLAGVAVAGRGRTEPASSASTGIRAALRAPGVARWLAAEIVANTAWAGTLVYAGALLVESYQASSAITGLALAVGAGAYVAGNFAFRRLADHEPRRLLMKLSVGLAVAITLFGVFRPSLFASAALFSAAAFAAGGRTLLASAFGLATAAEHRAGAMSMRASSIQLGYFTGSFVAGAALALGGFAAYGATIGALFALAALVLGRAPAPADAVAPVTRTGREPRRRRAAPARQRIRSVPGSRTSIRHVYGSSTD